MACTKTTWSKHTELRSHLSWGFRWFSSINAVDFSFSIFTWIDTILTKKTSTPSYCIWFICFRSAAGNFERSLFGRWTQAVPSNWRPETKWKGAREQIHYRTGKKQTDSFRTSSGIEMMIGQQIFSLWWWTLVQCSVNWFSLSRF